METGLKLLENGEGSVYTIDKHQPMGKRVLGMGLSPWEILLCPVERGGACKVK
ncbi:hypothetical protein [Lacrimispora indolis]|uniref:hypothetical protein n=1 Tax=Lacrimispora indolis TaxID=69825 RepID=UPI00041587BE|nr:MULTISPECIES: hypothetical protein [Lachnospiraceae]